VKYFGTLDVEAADEAGAMPGLAGRVVVVVVVELELGGADVVV
jgi:hypothetical protein